MYDLFITIITDPAIGIITGLIGFAIGNRVALHRDRVKETEEDIAEFRRSFVDTIHNLRHPMKNIAYDLPGTQEAHYKAKTRLEICLKGDGSRRLNKIWSKYEKGTKEYYPKFCGQDHDATSLWRKSFLSKIIDMLREINKIT